ncbi:hypothetical protein CVT26_012768 [Gymnopilus dilepis]|uniref:Uncharacterized protein n=1 Tax=Gymnopilus dilepis TaxID=231916 RepID=A0A409YPK3_9AGAR|nr:hypothetical protein CVT26_012768 [Gymnopilus dilepis]
MELGEHAGPLPDWEQETEGKKRNKHEEREKLAFAFLLFLCQSLSSLCEDRGVASSDVRSHDPSRSRWFKR